MLGSLLGSVNKERVLVYLAARGRGYARRSRTLRCAVVPRSEGRREVGGTGRACKPASRQHAGIRVQSAIPGACGTDSAAGACSGTLSGGTSRPTATDPITAATQRQASMKKIAEMSPEELAGLVCQALREAGITVTLSGGACVAIWSGGKYVSADLDFIEEGPVPRRRVAEVMKTLGFQPDEGRFFVHPDTPIFVEFPTGPLMVGDERVERAARATRRPANCDCSVRRTASKTGLRHTSTGTTGRHWNRPYSWRAQKIDLDDVKRWSDAEGNAEKFRRFRKRLRSGPQTA